MKHTLSIDLETFSSVPITKAGAWKYIQSPDFEILLFAYSLDNGPVQVIDLACGETMPDWLVSALTDPEYIKYSYNAPFEYGCLDRVYGGMVPSQWCCTMFHGLYCGYTAGLDATGKALGLPEDKQKLNTGKALIRYFCVPCKPSKSNGGRTRNLPKHDPDKWRLFKEYNVQDVVTEMEIEKRLSLTPVPDWVQHQWEVDLTINQRGVAVDQELVQGALYMGTVTREALMREATRITNLRNPNSGKQMLEWLNKAMETDEETGLSNLRKDTVSKMLDGMPEGDVKRVLEIRQELSKTSTKKYDAIEECVCSDNRVRGLLQFYGANRTGRWAGRLVQVQNLPRTYTKNIELARQLVRDKDTGTLRMIYGSVPDTLSQLIRTAFIASPGHVLVDADFSAIEARVISWLAGEAWRLEAFRQGKDIYCESASQMFGVPVVKHGVNGELRAKGKIAELALGYQGGVGALINMGALDMGLDEAELPEIVTRWRDANSRIKSLWYEMDNAAIEVIGRGGSATVRGLKLSREYDIAQGVSKFVIQLPSGRCLYYINPSLGTNQFGGSSIIYTGVDQTTKRWKQIETYGGKLTENCVQAIARDALAGAIDRLEAAGLPIVFHVHDEVVIDVAPFGTSKEMLDKVTQIMAEPIPWAPTLPLNADGWVGDFFTKD